MRSKNYFAVAVVVGGVFLARYTLEEITKDVLNSVQTPHEIRLEKLYNTKENYEIWNEIREKEREDGECLYMVEDMIPELNKPNEWENFFILKDIPEKILFRRSIFSAKSLL